MSMDSPSIAELMSEIDHIDLQVIWLLKDRFARSRLIGELKKQAGVLPVDRSRVSEQIESFVSLGEKAGLDRGMANTIITAVVQSVIDERMRGT